jgi:hypothetical protein
MFILSCELFVVSKYDETNCDFVYGVFFLQCILKCKF